MPIADDSNDNADSEFRGTVRSAGTGGQPRNKSETPESVESSSSSHDGVWTPKETSPEAEWECSPAGAGVGGLSTTNKPRPTQSANVPYSSFSDSRKLHALRSEPQSLTQKQIYGTAAAQTTSAQGNRQSVKSIRTYPSAGAKPSIFKPPGRTANSARASGTRLPGAGALLRNSSNTLSRKDGVSIADRGSSIPPTVPFSYGNRGLPLDSNIDPNQPKYPGMLLQPLSTAISLEELAKEIKAIYADLVVVELKCIDVDATAGETLDQSHYQALIALHRTLLYEHHDFLMATQHPSATPALRGLAAKYNMPARMWKHAIHAFLELLRRRRPESHEFMLSFICLAYQMMCLLYETVPIFTDTWIECLGDLGRYRMVIEEDREIHSIWGGTAGSWYTLAADRHPNIGRLNHHLAILEKPSLRKMFLYVKSLTCKVRFPNARDSLATFCAPFVQNEGKLTDSSSLEGSLVSYYALGLSVPQHPAIQRVRKEVLRQLKQANATKLRPLGVFLIVTNISAVLELGSPSSSVWQAFEQPPINNEQEKTLPDAYCFDFLSECFDIIVPRQNDRKQIKDALPSIHAALVWFKNIRAAGERLMDASPCEWLQSVTNQRSFPWSRLADFLNSLSKIDPISNALVECALTGAFPVRLAEVEWEKPLLEDYFIRGLVWAQNYYPDTWFDNRIDETERAFESPKTEQARIIRVQWLAIGLAQRTNWIKFDARTKLFFVPSQATGGLAKQSPLLLTSPTEPHHSFNSARPHTKSRNSFSTYSAYAPVEVNTERPKSTPDQFITSTMKQQQYSNISLGAKQKGYHANAQIQHENSDNMIYEYQHPDMQ